jgi:hypothetical protein
MIVPALAYALNSIRAQFLLPECHRSIAIKTNGTGLGQIRLAAAEMKRMTDEQLALQAVSDAQQLLEEYLEPRPRNNERVILDKLVEVLERPDLLVAVTRMKGVH